MDEAKKQKLSDMMGEGMVKKPKIMKFPIIKLHGNKGIFTRMDLDKEGNYLRDKQEIGKVFEGVIVGMRAKLVAKNPKAKLSMETNEFDGNNEVVKLWDYKDGKSLNIMTGTVKEIRDKYQTLKYQKMVYMVSGGEMIKLVVKGGSLGNLFDYMNSFPTGKHAFEYKTIIKPEEKTGDLGIFYAMTFSKEDIEEDPKTIELMERFHENRIALKNNYVVEEKPKDLPVVDLEDGYFDGLENE